MDVGRSDNSVSQHEQSQIPAYTGPTTRQQQNCHTCSAISISQQPQSIERRTTSAETGDVMWRGLCAVLAFVGFVAVNVLITAYQWDDMGRQRDKQAGG